MRVILWSSSGMLYSTFAGFKAPPSKHLAILSTGHRMMVFTTNIQKNILIQRSDVLWSVNNIAVIAGNLESAQLSEIVQFPNPYLALYVNCEAVIRSGGDSHGYGSVWESTNAAGTETAGGVVWRWVAAELAVDAEAPGVSLSL